MTIETTGDEVAHHDHHHHHHNHRQQHTLALRVRYLASPKAFVQAKAPHEETLAALKPVVLHHFGLVEGPVDGGRKEYAFSAHGVIQSNLGETLGHLAQGKDELELKLLEQFIQG